MTILGYALLLNAIAQLIVALIKIVTAFRR